MWWRNYSIFFQILPYIQKASILVSQGLNFKEPPFCGECAEKLQAFTRHFF